MNAAQSPLPRDPARTLTRIRSKGIELWSRQGRLHFRAPQGALSPQELEELRSCRDDIIRLLERSPDREADLERILDRPGSPVAPPDRPPRPAAIPESPGIRHAPLAFSQLAHWHLYQLDRRSAIRQLASVTRLQGPLDLDCLRASLRLVVNRHDALRTRIVRVKGALMQEIRPHEEPRLELHELSVADDACQDADLTRRIEQQIMQPIDPAKGPLCGVSLVKLGKHHHVLIVTLEHMISDAFSMGVFLRDLFCAYVDITRRRTLRLPDISMQFPDYAVRQHRELPLWRKTHDPYWRERFAGCERLRFPDSPDSARESRAGWGIIPIRIDSELKDQLIEWCRTHRTTLVMTVFAAYVALVLRWCNASRAIFQYQTDGRVDHRSQNAIGYFASVLYLRIALYERTTFTDLITQATAEYCHAYQHADQSYMEAQEPRPELAKNSCFNWVPRSADGPLDDSALHEVGLECSSVPFAHPMLRTLERDNEPVLLLFEKEHEITGGMHFSRRQLSAAPMQKLTDNFFVFLRAMLDPSDRRVSEVPLDRYSTAACEPS